MMLMVKIKKRIMTENDELAAYLFHQGTNFTSYEYLGSHMTKTSDGYEYVFRVWAPNAKSVSLVSDFTGWNDGITLERINA